MGELVDATGGVDEAGFAGEERVAGGTDTDFQVLDGGKRLIHSAASAADGGFECCRVDCVFHGIVVPRETGEAERCKHDAFARAWGRKNTGNRRWVKGYLRGGQIAKWDGIWSFLSG